jgi:hypothetical protein
MNPRYVPSIFRAASCCLSIGFLVLATGCGSSREPQQAEVSGKVLFQGKPLPGGKISFVAVKGGFSAVGTIDENGVYQIKAPVGEVQISVTNRMLQPKTGPKAVPKLAKAKVEEQPVKGQWVQIPFQYEDPSKSGLKYTVTKGAQTHDVELSANPG